MRVICLRQEYTRVRDRMRLFTHNGRAVHVLRARAVIGWCFFNFITLLAINMQPGKNITKIKLQRKLKHVKSNADFHTHEQPKIAPVIAES
jgi:hypothetical protein